eukprot:TRINITY_DN10114_c0_g2_i1.p1 TRINITY_DN10114_c0_g2~~TRINITY_DN10114_c0_g2_i1.p1  ORF type:complete len:517 (+),score=141.47 TRINITY_DN10114_c0_g2_i1:657-2207(+)
MTVPSTPQEQAPELMKRLCAAGAVREAIDDDGGAGDDVSASHPHGVQPLGNLLLTSRPNIRAQGIGRLSRVSDAAIQEVISYCGAADVASLAGVCRSLHCFANSEEVWKSLTLFSLRPDGKFFYRSSWRQSYIDTLWATQLRNGPAPAHVPIKVQGFYSDELYHSFRDARTPVPRSWLRVQNVPRVDASGLSKEAFVEQYEQANTPVVLRGIASEWPAFRAWTRERMERDWGEREFQCEAAKLTLSEYFRYCDGQSDDRPIYLFDKAFTETVPDMGSHFQVPQYFEDDLFKVLGEGRPDYRWLIMGPARSGSSFHVDPNSTDAWNACIQGRKRWLLYPPGAVPPGVVPSADGADVASPISIVEWFLSYYHRKASGGVAPLEVTVEPGEMMFIPNGWWHLCLNLTPTVCVTQNYVSRSGLSRVLRFLRDRPHCVSGVCDDDARQSLYGRFRSALERDHPALLEEAERGDKERREAKLAHTPWSAAVSAAPAGRDGDFEFEFGGGADGGGGFAFDFGS